MSAFIRRLGRVSGRILTKLPVPIADGGTGATSAGAATTALGAAALTAQTFTQIQRWSKGGDIVSASPLVIDTDGNFFDVTGTTNFAAMTVVAGSWFVLQFDAVLTMTHHSTNLDLPGQANITTAAGDVATFFATGTNTVQCTSYTRASGEAIVAAGGGMYEFVVAMLAEEDTSDTSQTGTTAMGTGITRQLVAGEEIVIEIGEIEVESTDGAHTYFQFGLYDGSTFYSGVPLLQGGGSFNQLPEARNNTQAENVISGNLFTMTNNASNGIIARVYGQKALGLVTDSSKTWTLATKVISGSGVKVMGASATAVWSIGIRKEIAP